MTWLTVASAVALSFFLAGVFVGALIWDHLEAPRRERQLDRQLDAARQLWEAEHAEIAALYNVRLVDPPGRLFDFETGGAA